MNRFVAGALGGIVATLPMTMVMTGLWKRLPTRCTRLFTGNPATLLFQGPVTESVYGLRATWGGYPPQRY